MSEPSSRAPARKSSYMPASHARAHFTREVLVSLFRYDPVTGALTVLSTGEEVVGTNSNGYRWLWVDGAALLVHRIAWRIMTGEWPAGMVDHIDGNRQNNAWTNLRPTDHARNAQNQHKAMATSSSGLLGAHRTGKKHGKPFRAAIESGDKKTALGTFDTALEAHQAYLKAKAEMHPGASITWRKP